MDSQKVTKNPHRSLQHIQGGSWSLGTISACKFSGTVMRIFVEEVSAYFCTSGERSCPENFVIQVLRNLGPLWQPGAYEMILKQAPEHVYALFVPPEFHLIVKSMHCCQGGTSLQAQYVKHFFTTRICRHGHAEYLNP